MTRSADMEIRVGLGTCGLASGGQAVLDAVTTAVRRIRPGTRVKAVGCSGLCHQEPVIEVIDADGRSSVYGRVTPEAARHIVEGHGGKGGWLRVAALFLDMAWRSVLDGEGTGRQESYAIDFRGGCCADYVRGQRRVVMENCGKADPLDIDEAVDLGGYSQIEKVLKTQTPEVVIETIMESGLRGRGGAGYPTSLKWERTRHTQGGRKFVICNGDEGDPGAFMDRLVLEGDPHRVIEGMLIAAYAVGASEGYFYIRAEYPLAVRNVRIALEQAERRGFLGDRIMSTDFCFRARVMEGAGAFVCGEETALIACLEGRRGMPRARPPYPAVSGLWSCPTLVNNVETLACVPWIIRNGSEAFSALGTQHSRGTKVFALAGKVRNGGLIEVPMGITLRDIVEKIGGGIRGARSFKAVQIGGPAGGCIPASLADTPVDYERIAKHGAIMGSGGLVVLDDSDCMVDIARFFLEFTQSESCGRCTFCRVGTKRMVEILNRLCAGQGTEADLTRLDELAMATRNNSLCGLGQNASNPVLTTMRYFRDEYEAHLAGRCPALKCKALIRFEVSDRCIGCTMCSRNCPVKAIDLNPYGRQRIDAQKCVRCGMCQSICPEKAIERRS